MERAADSCTILERNVESTIVTTKTANIKSDFTIVVQKPSLVELSEIPLDINVGSSVSQFASLAGTGSFSERESLIGSPVVK